jgi:hypothetical protein
MKPSPTNRPMENSESKEKKIPMPDLVLLVQNHLLCYKSRNLNYAGEAEEMAFKGNHL